MQWIKDVDLFNVPVRFCANPKPQSRKFPHKYQAAGNNTIAAVGWGNAVKDLISGQRNAEMKIYSAVYSGILN